jgi:uncharacterized RDD family membrane protein YckC
MIDMSLSEDPSMSTTTMPGYARFSRRLQGLVIDWILFLLLMAGTLFVIIALKSDSDGRYLGFAAIGIALLYEPLLVSLTGSTIGHYLTNLRVVDDRTKGNVSFAKALARFVIKAILGWYSFISMWATRRHQAVHDLLTFSTVQIRNPAKASAHHYSTERTEFDSPAMPSRSRRLVVIIGYLLLIGAVSIAATHVLLVAGLMSEECARNELRCRPAEYLSTVALGLSWLALSVLCIVLGWRGKLLGCRFRSVSA